MYALLIVIVLLLSFLLYSGIKALFENKNDRRNAFVIKEALDRVIRRNMLLISEIDTLGNKVIALDRKTKKIILVENRNNVTWKNVFHWARWKSCIIQ